MDESPQNAEHTTSARNETSTTRVVAFPDDVGHDEKGAPNVSARPKGVEMSRSMTQDERDLAAAGYEHLEAEKIKPGAPTIEANVDIQEHRLTFAGLQEALQADFDTKDPGKSHGLSAHEAEERLKRDGRNVLTPPKKKSALRKVCHIMFSVNNCSWLIRYVVHGSPFDHVQHSSDLRRNIGIYPSRDSVQGKIV